MGKPIFLLAYGNETIRIHPGKEKRRMSNEKLAAILEGVVFLAFGIIIAICGAGTAIDLYFGILCLVGGVACLFGTGYGISKKQPLSFHLLAMGAILLTVGIALFTDLLSFAALINLVIFILMGFGIGITLYGVISLLRKQTFMGVIQLVIGLGLITLTALYLGLADFRASFWLIVGILIAIYGGLLIIFAVVVGPKKKHR